VLTPAEFQREFLDVVRKRKDPALGVAFRGAGKLSNPEALNVYAEGYGARMFESLGENFETVWRVLGDEAFIEAARAFAQEGVSRSRNLNDYGETFPAFLRERFAGSTFAAALSDLARFEWAFADCFNRPFFPPLTAFDLTEFAGCADIRLEWVPSLEVFEAQHPVQRVHRDAGTEAGWNELVDNPEATVLLLRRSPTGVVSHTATPQLVGLLREFKRHVELSRFIEAAGSMERVSEWMNEIVEVGVLASLIPVQPPSST